MRDFGLKTDMTELCWVLMCLKASHES